jgi:SAM-dependent methyltransferase
VEAKQATLRAYERWARSYPPVAHNPLMRVEEQAMLDRWPDVAGRRVLDLASGSGRYSGRLIQTGAAAVVAMDFCLPMLAQVSAGLRICGDMMQLPFARGVFGAVISGLAIGHASTLGQWLAEVSRVMAPGAVLLYSDFHPQAARAGLTRSFKDENQQTCTVPHQCYEVGEQRAAITAAGLQLDAMHEIRVGEELYEPFPGSDKFYRDWHGLPIVLVVRAVKAAA